MSGFATEEYNSCKRWVAAKIQTGATWEDVKPMRFSGASAGRVRSSPFRNTGHPHKYGT